MEKSGSSILVSIPGYVKCSERSKHVKHWNTCIFKWLLLNISELLPKAILTPRQHTNFPNESLMDITHIKGGAKKPLQVEFYVKGRYPEKISLNDGRDLESDQWT